MTDKENFRFTRVWRELISLLHEQVVLKRRKYLARSSIGPVFSGSNAVEVLHRHIQIHPEMFPNQNFGRVNCARLCQRFLDLRVFHPSKDKGTSLKIIFEDSHFAFYRFNCNSDYVGAPTLNRSMKRSNSETDLLSSVSLPKNAKLSSPNLTKQISSLSSSLIPNRIRKSIRRRSSQKPDSNLGTISEKSKRMTMSHLEQHSICEESFCASTPKISRRSNGLIARSNAFRLSDTRLMNESLITTRSLSKKISSVSINSIKSTPNSTFQISTPIIESRRRSFQKFYGSCSKKIEARKKVKSMADFHINHMNLSFAL